MTPSAWAQVPDNRGVKLNPEDSAPQAYRDTIEERDRRRLDAARRLGESFVPLLPGRGQEPGYEPRPVARNRRGRQPGRRHCYSAREAAGGRRGPPTKPIARKRKAGPAGPKTGYRI